MKKKLRLKKHCATAVLLFLVAGTLRAQPVTSEQFYMRALSAEPGKPSVFELAFTTQTPLQAEAEFAFEFPVEFDLAQLQIAGSPDINGGFALKRDKQKVWVKRSGLGQNVAAGTLVRLRLGAIGIPKNLNSDLTVLVQLRPQPQSTWTAPVRSGVVFVTHDKSE